jgi:hypothetical protein
MSGLLYALHCVKMRELPLVEIPRRGMAAFGR